jgi:hypothetical protein
VSRTYTPVTTASAWPPADAIAMTSPVSPPAPLGSLALKVMTHAGASSTSGAVASGMGSVGEVEFAIGEDFAFEQNNNIASIQSIAFYVKAI